MATVDEALLSTLGDVPEPGGDAYAVVDGCGALLSWSPAAQRLLGYTAEELRALRGSDLLAGADDVARLRKLWRGDRTVLLNPARLRRRDGSAVTVVLWAHPLASPGDRTFRLVQAEPADVAHQREIRHALLRGLFTESPYIIDVFDSGLRFLAQNHSSRRPGGFAHEVVGRTMREVAPAGLLDMDALEERQRKVLSTGEAMIGTAVRGRGMPEDPDREAVWSETIVPLRDGTGQVVALAHLVLDVTQEARARERLDLVNEASARLGGSLDVVRIAQELTDVAVPRFADCAYVNLFGTVFGDHEPGPSAAPGAEPLRRVAISMRAGRSLDLRVAIGETDTFASAPGSPAARALTGGGHVLLTGDELFAEVARTDPQRAALVRELRVRCWLLVPLYARGAALGAVVFFRCGDATAFEADDILLAREFANRAGTCLDNASRYTHERATVQALQRSLLPQRLPDLGGVEVASRYLPAPGHALLGGAWFDVLRLSSARVGLVVGDAAGSGLRAAVTMGGLRTAVRTLADLDLPPDELLTQLNEQVKRLRAEQGTDVEGAAGTTCLYAVVDPISRRCALASAGHGPPARVTAGGQARVVDMPVGPPIGAGGVPYECGELALADGDLLVLETGGPPGRHGDRHGGTGDAALVQVLRDLFARSPAGPPLQAAGLGGLCDAVLHRILPEPPERETALLATLVRGLPPDRYAAWDLAPEAEVVGRARELAARTLGTWGLEHLVPTTELLVSELVTNAIRYGLPPIRLRLIRDRDLICEVSDGSSTSPHVRRALDTDEGGRGLFMVAQIADLWGTRYHARGKAIWAEQRPQGAPH